MPFLPAQQVEKMTKLDANGACPFVGESLRQLSSHLRGTDATLLGFVGAPFTRATYIVEVSGTHWHCTAAGHVSPM